MNTETEHYRPSGLPTNSSAAPKADRRDRSTLASVITNALGFSGYPGDKMLDMIAAILGDDIPLDEYRALLASRRKRAIGFGLALPLAKELRTRWDADAAARVNRQAAELKFEIDRLESILRDPSLTAEERAHYESYRDDLMRRPPKSETNSAQAGAGAKGQNRNS